MEKNNETLIVEADCIDTKYWYDLWHCRELFYFFVWRDLLVRYKQTVMGISWAILRPLLTIIIFTIVFSVFAKLPSDGVPYPILVLTALIPWQFFSNAFSEASNSLVNNSNLISKIYFPRMILPVSSIFTCFVDFAISFLLLLGLMLWYQVIPNWHIIFLPIFVALTCLISFGAGLWVAALSVKYRDFRIIVPFIVQVGLYISPVGYSSSIVPESYKFIYSFNPMVGVIDGFRWSILGDGVALNMPSLFLSLLLIIILCIVGVFYFRKTERNFADII